MSGNWTNDRGNASPTDAQLLLVVKTAPTKWRQVTLSLGVPMVQIDALADEHRNNEMAGLHSFLYWRDGRCEKNIPITLNYLLEKVEEECGHAVAETLERGIFGEEEQQSVQGTSTDSTVESRVGSVPVLAVSTDGVRHRRTAAHSQGLEEDNAHIRDNCKHPCRVLWSRPSCEGAHPPNMDTGDLNQEYQPSCKIPSVSGPDSRSMNREVVESRTVKALVRKSELSYSEKLTRASPPDRRLKDDFHTMLIILTEILNGFIAHLKPILRDFTATRKWPFNNLLLEDIDGARSMSDIFKIIPVEKCWLNTEVLIRLVKVVAPSLRNEAREKAGGYLKDYNDKLREFTCYVLLKHVPADRFTCGDTEALAGMPHLSVTCDEEYESFTVADLFEHKEFLCTCLDIPLKHFQYIESKATQRILVVSALIMPSSQAAHIDKAKMAFLQLEEYRILKLEIKGPGILQLCLRGNRIPYFIKEAFQQNKDFVQSTQEFSQQFPALDMDSVTDRKHTLNSPLEEPVKISMSTVDNLDPGIHNHGESKANNHESKTITNLLEDLSEPKEIKTVIKGVWWIIGLSILAMLFYLAYCKVGSYFTAESSQTEAIVKEECHVWMMLGVTGAGKSCLGNLLIGQDNIFPESEIILKAKTQNASMESTIFDGEKLCVIDNPGLGDPLYLGEHESKAMDIAKDASHFIMELTKMMLMTKQGINAFLIVVPLHHRDYTGLQRLLEVLDILGSYWNHSIVVFTHGKAVGITEEDQYKTLNYLLTKDKECPPILKSLVEKVNGRFVIAEAKEWRSDTAYRHRVVSKIRTFSDAIVKQHGHYQDNLQSIGNEALEKAKLQLCHKFEDMESPEAKAAIFESAFQHVREAVFKLVKIKLADGENVDKLKEMAAVKDKELGDVRRQRDLLHEEFLKEQKRRREAEEEQRRLAKEKQKEEKRRKQAEEEMHREAKIRQKVDEERLIVEKEKEIAQSKLLECLENPLATFIKLIIEVLHNILKWPLMGIFMVFIHLVTLCVSIFF